MVPKKFLVFLTSFLLISFNLPAQTAGTAFMVVDPDWAPYESIDAQGVHVGIAADLVKLVAQRSGVNLKLLPTKDWDESILATQDGRAQVISFLNQTRKREEWLLFTEAYFTDPNVFITREEHDYISDPARLTGETLVLPSGTSIEERVRAEYPNFSIILVPSEREAIRMVEQRGADLTLRSLTMAAYTIRKEGLFNLKIAGQIPSFTNQFRMGVIKSRPDLRDALNKGVATITPSDIQAVVNRHISIQVLRGVDYIWALGIGLGTLILTSLGGLWIYQLRRLNGALALREAEKTLILKEVHHRIKNNMNTLQGILYLQSATPSEKPAAEILTDAQNRIQSMMILYDKLYQSVDYGRLNAREYLSDLIDKILENFPLAKELRVKKDLADFDLSSEQLQHLGILLYELLTNAMKYAYPKGSGSLLIQLEEKDRSITLRVEDDGPGLPENTKDNNRRGFGLELVGLLAQQLGGDLVYEKGQENKGTRIILKFPRS